MNPECYTRSTTARMWIISPVQYVQTIRASRTMQDVVEPVLSVLFFSPINLASSIPLYSPLDTEFPQST